MIKKSKTSKTKSTYPQIVGYVEIVEIREATEDDCCGLLLGYYTYGHWDSQSFAIAVNKERELDAKDNPCVTTEVVQGYVTPDFCDFEDEHMNCLFFSESPVSEAKTVTYWHCE